MHGKFHFDSYFLLLVSVNKSIIVPFKLGLLAFFPPNPVSQKNKQTLEPPHK